MRITTLFLLAILTACGDSIGLPTTGTNFAIINRSSDPATVVLHRTDWSDSDADGVPDTWVERSDTAFILTVQAGVRTCVLLNLDAVSGTVTTPSDTLPLSVFWLAETNTWTVTIHVESGPIVNRAAVLRGQGCVP